MIKKRLDKAPIGSISISDECLDLIEKSKPPFESAEEYINRLIKIQDEYNQQKGIEFIDMIFNRVFLRCSQEYMQERYSSSKKEKIKEDLRGQIKNSINELFESYDDNILPLLLLIDESITLLFQTEFFDIIANSKESEFEKEIMENEYLKVIK